MSRIYVTKSGRTHNYPAATKSNKKNVHTHTFAANLQRKYTYLRNKISDTDTTQNWKSDFIRFGGCHDQALENVIGKSRDHKDELFERMKPFDSLHKEGDNTIF